MLSLVVVLQGSVHAQGAAYVSKWLVDGKVVMGFLCEVWVL